MDLLICNHIFELDLDLLLGVAGDVEGDDDDDDEETLAGQLQGQTDASRDVSKSIIYTLGKETVKQYMAAANLLQAIQQIALFGDLTVPRITQSNLVKRNFKVRKRTENLRQMRSLVDAAKGEALNCICDCHEL